MKVTDQLLVFVLCVPMSLWTLFKVGLVQTSCVRTIPKQQSNNNGGVTNLRTSSTQQATETSVPSSNTIVKNDNNDPDAPLLLLHVGPRKTGTTTVQWFAGSHLERLEQDNFYFVGQNPEREDMKLHLIHKKCAKCKPSAEEDCLQEWKKFDETLKHHYEQNHNVIVSEELFSSFHDPEDAQEHLWRHLLPMLEKFRVRVVITHRRYFEWVPSKYFQIYNPGSKPSKDAMRANWPDNGGRPIPPFPKYFESVLRADHKFPTAMKHKWDLRFDNVQVFNMHNGEEFVHSFFCQMLPEATKLCNYLTTEYKSTVKNSKSSKVLHYDMLAVGAYQKGLLPKDSSLSRYDVSRASEAHAQELGLKSQKDFAQHCLSQEQADKLLHLSKTFESTMVPEFFLSERGEADLEQEFNKASDMGMYCSIDVDKVLKEPEWGKFFQNLSQSP